MTRRTYSMCCLVGISIVWTVHALAGPIPPHTSKPSIRIQQKGTTLNIQKSHGNAWRQIEGLNDIRSVGIAPGIDEKSATAYFFNKNGDMVGKTQSDSILWNGGSAKSQSKSMWVQQGSGKKLVKSLVISSFDQPNSEPMKPTPSPTDQTNQPSVNTGTTEQTITRSPEESSESSGKKLGKDLGKIAAAEEIVCIYLSSKSEKNRTLSGNLLEKACDAPKALSREAWAKITEHLSTKK
jgi:hypothetical protein